ncbi:MAG: hypothetical protein PHI34_07720 [Acidobacteriota bacterium]|nr:hypothetical protein [Acidobacteriota bacterium]
MNKKRGVGTCLLVCVAAALVTSCVHSLQPLYEDKDLVFEPRLLGTWTDGDGEDAWTFERGSGDTYFLTCRTSEDLEAARFEGRLGKLGGAYFLDLFPDRNASNKMPNGLLAMHLVPAHMFWRVRFEGGLHIDPFSQDWLKAGIAAGRIKIAHVETPDEILLTAGSKELQAFLAGLAADLEAFPPSDKPLRKR